MPVRLNCTYIVSKTTTDVQDDDPNICIQSETSSPKTVQTQYIRTIVLNNFGIIRNKVEMRLKKIKANGSSQWGSQFAVFAQIGDNKSIIYHDGDLDL